MGGGLRGTRAVSRSDAKPDGFEEVIEQYSKIGIGYWCTHDTDVIPSDAIGTGKQDEIVGTDQAALIETD